MTDRRPTVSELESILHRDDSPSIEILPDGSIHTVDGEPHHATPKIWRLSKLLRDGATYAAIILASALCTACAPKLIQDTSARAVCPPIKVYTSAQQLQVAAEMKNLPPDAETVEWITDYISLRDILRACAK